MGISPKTFTHVAYTNCLVYFFVSIFHIILFKKNARNADNSKRINEGRGTEWNGPIDQVVVWHIFGVEREKNVLVLDGHWGPHKTCAVHESEIHVSRYWMQYFTSSCHPFPSSLSSLPVSRIGKKKSSREEQGTSLLSDLRRTTLRVTHRNLSSTPTRYA